ncbi:MAG TPA: transposase [Bryobacteraceae bacterium]
MREDRREHWAKTISEQESSGLSVQAFCRERGVDDCSFYRWRRKVGGAGGPVRFALIETKSEPAGTVPLELIFTNGERLRISQGADAAILQLVLTAVRA